MDGCIHNSLVSAIFLLSVQDHRRSSLNKSSLASCHLILFSFFFFSFLLFATMFALPNGDFLQIKDTATHSWTLDLLFCVQLADTFSVLQLACLAIFRQKPEFQGV